MPRQLKVFRTAIGFRDAYVAAPSKAAALRAWGTKKDLFARGAAELVTDPALTADALSKPGEVVYRTRGGLEEQVAALGTLPKKQAKPPRQGAAEPTRKSPASKPRPVRPRPSRAEVEAAEAKLRALDDEQVTAEAQIRRREQEVADARKAMEAGFAKRREALRLKSEQARAAYEKALRAWEP